MTFEESLRQLEEVVTKLESGELSMEESMELFKTGVERAKACYAIVRDARGKLQVLDEDLKAMEWDIHET